MDDQQQQPPQNDAPKQDVAALSSRIESLEQMISQLMAKQPQEQRSPQPEEATDRALQRQQEQPQSILDSTPAETFKQQEQALHERALRSMGISPRRTIPQRQNPETARLNDGSRQPMPYDEYDMQTINDTAETIRQATAQTEVVSIGDRIYALANRLAAMEQKVGVLYPPMPRGKGTGGIITGTFTAVTSNGYSTSTHVLSYTTSTFTISIDLDAGTATFTPVANSPATFETAVSGTCT
jgi:hypothetical protein